MASFAGKEAEDALKLKSVSVVDEDDDEEEEDEGGGAEGAEGTKKKKKKKKSKKKKKGPSGTTPPHGRMLGGFTDYYTKYGQTEPPSIAVHELSNFKSGQFPQGQIMPHGTTRVPDAAGPELTHYLTRVSEAERRELDTSPDREALYQNARRAAECHRQVRAHAQSYIKPGIKLIDMCDRLENMNRTLLKEAGLEAGPGFPTGCSINHVAAHYTPNCGDDTVLHEDDVMKVDFGSQVDGRIIDCAWTVAFNPRYDPLLQAVKEATECGIKCAGIDVQMSEIGEQIQEVMESHEVEIDGKVYPVKCCRNLNGHSIGRYEIHAGKSVPIVKNNDSSRMVEGEFYAIETFGSTGDGYVVEQGECSHYMKDFNCPHVPLTMGKAKKLLGHINKTYSTLAFCRRWLERDDGGSYAVHKFGGKQEHYMGAMKVLCDQGIVNEYPPLVDTFGRGCYTAQYEHTLILRPTCKEILSRGDDF